MYATNIPTQLSIYISALYTDTHGRVTSRDKLAVERQMPDGERAEKYIFVAYYSIFLFFTNYIYECRRKASHDH